MTDPQLVYLDALARVAEQRERVARSEARQRAFDAQLRLIINTICAQNTALIYRLFFWR